jgi:hypothetical protein
MAVDTNTVGEVIPAHVGIANVTLIVACVVAVVASVVNEV